MHSCRREHRWAGLLALAQAEVQSTLDALPEELRSRAKDLPVAYESWPDRHWRRTDVAPDTLGLFVGVPLAEREPVSGELAPHIVLFLENLWDEAGEDEEIFKEEVRVTYLHELGHYLGLDELGLEERGL